MPTEKGRATALGQLVRARRLARHLSMEEASKEAGMSRATWGDLERGAKTPQRGTLERVERVLEWPERSTTAYLQGGPEPAPLVHADELAAKAPPLSSLTTEQDGQGRFQIRVVDKAGREVVVLAFPGSVTMTPETIEYLAKIAMGVSLDEHAESEPDS
jgi:transcriptional regulator with XRE-family HTH domain